MSRFTGGVLCGVASLMLGLCAFHLAARGSVGAAFFVTAVAVGLLLATVASLRAGMR